MNAPVKSFAGVSVAVLSPVARLNLRIATANLAAASTAFTCCRPRSGKVSSRTVTLPGALGQTNGCCTLPRLNRQPSWPILPRHGPRLRTALQ